MPECHSILRAQGRMSNLAAHNSHRLCVNGAPLFNRRRVKRETWL